MPVLFCMLFSASSNIKRGLFVFKSHFQLSLNICLLIDEIVAVVNILIKNIEEKKSKLNNSNL